MASFLVFACSFAFAQEEVNYLLFKPDSSTSFVDEAQTKRHLDNVARYLKDKKLVPGQIQVYGYAANIANNVDPMILSRARAVFVINELVKRGLPRNLFADPSGLGSVDLWGSGDDRNLNRRVRIVLDGHILTPEALKEEPVKVVEPKPEPKPEPEPEVIIVKKEKPPRKPVPWSLGVSAGTSFDRPWVIATPHATVSPTPASFLAIGADFGFIHDIYVQNPETGTKVKLPSTVKYFSVYPFLHYAYFLEFAGDAGWYIGGGGGFQIARYKFPAEDDNEYYFGNKLGTVSGISVYDNFAAIDVVTGFIWKMLIVSYTLRIGFPKYVDAGVIPNHKLSIGYVYRFNR